MKKSFKLIAAIALIAVFACIFLACVPSDFDRAKTKMEKAGYYVLSDGSSFKYEGLEKYFTAQKIKYTEDPGTLTALYFESTSAAKKAYEKLGQTSAKQSGKWVYYGNENGIKAFEK